jgi:hypothetical protein
MSSPALHWDHGFESYTRHGVFIFICLVAALRQVDPQVYGVLPVVYRIHNVVSSLIQNRPQCVTLKRKKKKKEEISKTP